MKTSKKKGDTITVSCWLGAQAEGRLLNHTHIYTIFNIKIITRDPSSKNWLLCLHECFAPYLILPRNAVKM